MRAARAARLFFLFQPTISLISGVVAAIAQVVSKLLSNADHEIIGVEVKSNNI